MPQTVRNDIRKLTHLFCLKFRANIGSSKCHQSILQLQCLGLVQTIIIFIFFYFEEITVDS